MNPREKKYKKYTCIFSIFEYLTCSNKCIYSDRDDIVLRISDIREDGVCKFYVVFIIIYDE